MKLLKLQLLYGNLIKFLKNLIAHQKDVKTSKYPNNTRING